MLGIGDRFFCAWLTALIGDAKRRGRGMLKVRHLTKPFILETSVFPCRVCRHAFADVFFFFVATCPWMEWNKRPLRSRACWALHPLTFVSLRVCYILARLVLLLLVLLFFLSCVAVGVAAVMVR